MADQRTTTNGERAYHRYSTGVEEPGGERRPRPRPSRIPALVVLVVVAVIIGLVGAAVGDSGADVGGSGGTAPVQLLPVTTVLPGTEGSDPEAPVIQAPTTDVPGSTTTTSAAVPSTT